MMRRFHFVGGLLRSGSTLLCNILNQNPRFYVSSTSPVPSAVSSVSAAWSRSVEIKGMLVKNREATKERITRTIRAIPDAWYADLPTEVEIVIDKSRAWNFHAPLIQSVWPGSKIITIVRDLRSIYASIEKQHTNTGYLDEAANLAQKTVIERADWMFSADAPLGSALMGVEDLIRRNPKNWIRLRYEDLCQHPQNVLERLYHELGEPAFEHDFHNVKNVAEDVDELYNLKFPHEGMGPVRPLPTGRDWEEWISPDIERAIKRFSLYSQAFDYT
jgi:sulfotransferase